MATYDSPSAGSDYAHALALSPDGDQVFVSGLSARGGDGPTGTTLDYSTTNGTVAWQTTDPAVGGDIVAGSSRVYVGGTSIVAFDARTGARAWEAGGLMGSKLALNASETQVFVMTGVTSTSDPKLVALDAATGTVQWARHLGPKDLVFGGDIVVAPSGDVIYVTGSRNAPRSSGITTSAYNTRDGSRLWVTTDRSSGSEYGTGWSVTVSGDGRTVFAAASKGSSFTTISYAARSGKVLWMNGLHRPEWYSAAALSVIEHDGQVFAAEITDLDGLFGFVTVSYDVVTGARLWTRGQRQLYALSGLAVSPDGQEVFVEGECSSGMATDRLRSCRRRPANGPERLKAGVESSGTNLVLYGQTERSSPWENEPRVRRTCRDIHHDRLPALSASESLARMNASHRSYRSRSSSRAAGADPLARSDRGTQPTCGPSRPSGTRFDAA